MICVSNTIGMLKYLPMRFERNFMNYPPPHTHTHAGAQNKIILRSNVIQIYKTNISKEKERYRV